MAPGGIHEHRNPSVAEIRYLRVRYYARVYCADRRMTVGVQMYIAGLVTRYGLPWSARVVYRSMNEVLSLCAGSGRVWPRTVLWASPQSPERVAHNRRLQAAGVRRAARRLNFDRPRGLLPVPVDPLLLVEEGVPAPPSVEAAPEPAEARGEAEAPLFFHPVHVIVHEVGVPRVAEVVEAAV